MKRFLLAVVLLFVLSGCSHKNRDMERLIDFRQQITNGDGCTFDAYITADYGEKLYTFVLQCKTDQMGNLYFDVVEPDSITGITGVVSAEKGTLTFDDKVLAFSLLADGHISPVSAPWILMKTLQGGYIKACGKEDALLRAVIDDSYEDDSIQVDVWFDEHTNPVHADFLWKGRRIITMEVKNYQHL